MVLSVGPQRFFKSRATLLIYEVSADGMYKELNVLKYGKRLEAYISLSYDSVTKLHQTWVKACF